jgi:hypothetical protein
VNEAAAIPVTCPTCHRRIRMRPDGTVVEVIQEGGGRQPAVHRALATWRIWRDARAGEHRVVGPCPRCAMPMTAPGEALPWAAPATLETPKGPVVVGPETLTGPKGPLTDTEADAFLEDQLAERLTADQILDPRLLFVGVLVAILGLIFLVWLGSALFVGNFLFSMGTQGDFSGPMAPGAPMAPR